MVVPPKLCSASSSSIRSSSTSASGNRNPDTRVWMPFSAVYRLKSTGLIEILFNRTLQISSHSLRSMFISLLKTFWLRSASLQCSCLLLFFTTYVLYLLTFWCFCSPWDWNTFFRRRQTHSTMDVPLISSSVLPKTFLFALLYGGWPLG